MLYKESMECDVSRLEKKKETESGFLHWIALHSSTFELRQVYSPSS